MRIARFRATTSSTSCTAIPRRPVFTPGRFQNFTFQYYPIRKKRSLSRIQIFRAPFFLVVLPHSWQVPQSMGAGQTIVLDWYIMMECPSCHKTLHSDNAFRQHYRDKHGGHICTDCHRTFRSSHALQRHSERNHASRNTSSGARDHSHNDPYPGIEGYWTPRLQYQGTRKSFGSYECCSCSKKWLSAHAYKKYKQGCQGCENMSFPCCLWVNSDQDRDRSPHDRLDNGDRPHDRARCEACRRGVCDASSYGY